MREALALECTEAETALALQGLGAYPIVQSGPELARRWVPKVARGEAVAAFALTEPDVYTVFPRTTAGSGARGVTAFVVPRRRREVGWRAPRYAPTRSAA